MIGQSIAHYTITEKIGQGGMGEVYRATDTKLKRDVALKVLPDSFARDPQRMGRFRREAEVLASLNHPNIAGIHGLEREGDTHAIAMELVEGETLAARISKGAIPLGEALKIALQIAEALEAAHEKGIIHRDLKPANVIVTPEGTAKVLDFGLAKAMDPEPSSDADLSQSPTLTMAATQAGIILGTAAYMSPEQARGVPVDKRADIWAFGCVLFEMLTGQAAFGGNTVTDVLARILEREPDWDSLPPALPPSVSRLLRRCLTKGLRHRLHDIADARLELIEASSLSESPTLEKAQPTLMGRVGIRRFWLLSGGLLLVGTFLGAALSKLLQWDTPAPTAVVRFGFPLPSEIRFDDLSPTAISPDGRHLVLPGVDSLFLKRIDELEAKPILGTEDAEFPFFSPNGEWIGFFARGSVRKVLVKGGPPITIGVAPGVTGGGTWTADGNIIFGAHYSLWRVSADGGIVEQISGEVINCLFLKELPGHNALLLSLETEEGPRVAVVSLETGKTRILLDGSSAYYLPTGHLVFTRSGSLLAVRFDLATLKVTGTPVPVLDTIYAPLWAGLPVAHYSVSDTGTLVYLSGGQARRHLSRLVRVDRTGRATTITSQTNDFAYPRVSQWHPYCGFDADRRRSQYLDGRSGPRCPHALQLRKPSVDFVLEPVG